MSRFLFVDCIRAIEPGRHARGGVAVPPDVGVPGWLIAEAIGQLAGWAAMADSDFRCRPLASRAGEVRVELHGPRGRWLDLSVEIRRCDENLVVYRGAAALDGRPAGSLERCVGPMLPMEEFDDPAAVRRSYERLCDQSAEDQLAAARTIAGELPLLTIGGTSGRSLLARLHVPGEAPFFADHFPRRPLFPATLLLDAQARVAMQLAAAAMRVHDLAGLRLKSVRDVKVRAFTGPGQALDILAELRSSTDTAAVLAVSADSGGKRIATVNVEVGKSG
jgi:3-hydroxymyristoyl/3-hydroxydecanoyl-(acyl carrier protein) dehydratase